MDTIRALEDGKSWLRERLARHASPFDSIDPEIAAAAIEELDGLEPEPWTAIWGGCAEAAELRARDAEAVGDAGAARDAWMTAYECWFLGRYPAPLDPLKEACYERARAALIRATSYDEPPLELVTLPFAGRAGEGSAVTFYLVRPPATETPPVVMLWGGIDTWKEECHSRARLLVERDFAVLLMDMPGVGQSPLRAGVDAERQWDPVFEWLAGRDDLDGERVATLGLSFGGYWAMKLAYTHRERLAAAVNWGGGVHLTFQPEWQERSRNASSYLMDLMPTRARIFGGSTFDDYISQCPTLSLLDQGLLDRESAPLLLVNGRHDLQNATDDIYLSLEHGDVKSARIYPGGHMGQGPILPTVADWLAARLG